MFHGSGRIDNFVWPYLPNPIELIDVELVPWETAKIGIYKGMLKYTDIHETFETASLWNWARYVFFGDMKICTILPMRAKTTKHG